MVHEQPKCWTNMAHRHSYRKVETLIPKHIQIPLWMGNPSLASQNFHLWEKTVRRKLVLLINHCHCVSLSGVENMMVKGLASRVSIIVSMGHPSLVSQNSHSWENIVRLLRRKLVLLINHCHSVSFTAPFWLTLLGEFMLLLKWFLQRGFLTVNSLNGSDFNRYMYNQTLFRWIKAVKTL